MRNSVQIPTMPLDCGRYRARLAQDGCDLQQAQALRYLAFRSNGAHPDPDLPPLLDTDPLDGDCLHVLVEDRATGALVCCYRLLPLADGQALAACYAARFYDLSPLARYEAPLLEMGRFCIRPGWTDFDILRAAWAAATAVVDARGVQLLFGCSSFRGTDPSAYQNVFALLRTRHLGPERLRPQVSAPETYPLGQAVACPRDPARGRADMPPLLRTYLRMGGWVSDHAVIDRDLGTMHVFTGLETRAVPEARARALRGLLEPQRQA